MAQVPTHLVSRVRPRGTTIASCLSLAEERVSDIRSSHSGKCRTYTYSHYRTWACRDRLTFNQLSQTRTPNSPQHAIRNVSTSETSTSGENHGNFRINVLVQTMKDLIKDGDVAQAEALLNEADLSQMNDPIRLFNLILNGYAEVGNQKGVKRIFEALLSNPNLPKPDEQSYGVCLKALPPDQVDNLLTKMANLGLATTSSFNTIIANYCRHGNPNRASQILERLHEYSKLNPQVQPDVFSYSPMIRVLGQRGMPLQAQMLVDAMKARGVQPDLIAWSSLLHAWATSHRPEAPAVISNLWDQMYQQGIVPDTAVCNTVLLSFANTPNQGPDAEEMLRTCVPAPDVISYSTVLLAWKNSPDLPEAVPCAEALIQEMQERGIAPNGVVYSTLIALYARAGMAERAEEVLLQRMESPNVLSYTALLDAWASSGSKDAYQRAMSIFGSMKVKPNVTTFNTLIKVIERCPDAGVHPSKMEALAQIRALMQESRCAPNIRTFNAVFRVFSSVAEKNPRYISYVLSTLHQVRALMRTDIDNYTYPSVFAALIHLKAPFQPVIVETFQLCIEDNAVSRMVTSHLKRYCTKEELEMLLPMVKDVYNFDLVELPSKWRRRYEKVHQKKRQKRD